jgi:signal peptidase I
MAETRARDRTPAERSEEPRDPERPSEAGTPEGGGAARPKRFIGSTPFLILVAIVIAIVIKTFVVQAFYIPSESMLPTLEVGDRVFVNKFVYDIGDIERGDVIVFSNPNPGAGSDRGIVGGFLHWLGEGIGFAQPEDEDYIKRVVGLPGETIRIDENVVSVDGTPLDEPYLTRAAARHNGDGMRFDVPEGSLFVMGDNRGNSGDSRYGLGFVPLDKVIGEAFVVIWPPSHLGGLG